MVSGSDHYCAVIGQDVLGEMFTLTIGQFRENHFSCQCMVSDAVMPLDKRLVGKMFTLTFGQLNGWEEGILLNRSLDDWMKSCKVWL